MRHGGKGYNCTAASRCESRGRHFFCSRPENRPYFWPRWHFSIARPENRPFSWPALSRRREPFGFSSRSLLRIAGWPLPAMVPYLIHPAHLDKKTVISLLGVQNEGLPMWIERPSFFNIAPFYSIVRTTRRPSPSNILNNVFS